MALVPAGGGTSSGPCTVAWAERCYMDVLFVRAANSKAEALPLPLLLLSFSCVWSKWTENL